ncbi:GAF and ANTAR domain-containing protein [Kineococcus sp. SYSU DK003]|uniref:GAF and ANTAR domain-containing protein n=1 Tax=Kineococcus sp. SYSU DK003 TaxID=3383124 RepID=UPI003D7DF28D
MPLALEAAHLQLGQIPLSQPLSSVLKRVADLAVQCVPGADDVSVALLRGRRAHTVAFHGDLASTLDERQYAPGSGPCLTAAQSARVVRIGDTARDDAFPDFCELAVRRGVRSVVSVGLPASDRWQGSLTGYCCGEEADPRTAAEVEAALVRFAQLVAVTLDNAAALAEAGDRAQNLHIAMQSRAVIEQAKGVLVARHRVDADRAFEMLTTMSQHRNRKVRDIAEELVTSAAGTAGDGAPQ